MRHHAGRVVLEDVAVVHPHAGPSSGYHAIRTVPFGGTLITSSSDRQAGFFPIDLEDLEKEAVQVERMIHHRRVDDVPDLKFADLHGLVMMVTLSLTTKSNPRRRLILKPNFTVRVTGAVPATSGAISRSRFGMRAVDAFRRDGATASSTRSAAGRSTSSAATGASINPPSVPMILERAAAEGETNVAGARCVDDPPTFDLSSGDRQLRLGPR